MYWAAKSQKQNCARSYERKCIPILTCTRCGALNFSRNSLSQFIIGDGTDSTYYNDDYQYQVTTPRGELHIYTGDPEPANVPIFGKKTNQKTWIPLQLDDDAQHYWDYLRASGIAFFLLEKPDYEGYE